MNQKCLKKSKKGLIEVQKGFIEVQKGLNKGLYTNWVSGRWVLLFGLRLRLIKISGVRFLVC